MADAPHNSKGTAWIDKTSLVQLRTKTKEEIDRHKWYESEKAGYDIGWRRAERDWNRKHKARFFQDHA